MNFMSGDFSGVQVPDQLVALAVPADPRTCHHKGSQCHRKRLTSKLNIATAKHSGTNKCTEQNSELQSVD